MVVCVCVIFSYSSDSSVKTCNLQHIVASNINTAVLRTLELKREHTAFTCMSRCVVITCFIISLIVFITGHSVSAGMGGCQ